MFAVIVNVITVLIGSTVGLLCKKGIPKRLSDAVMLGIGMCTLYIGVSGTLKGENTIVLILSMVLGAIIGTALDIDGGINRLGKWIENKFSHEGEKISIAQGFVTACLLFCVGAMTIVGSLNAGLTGDYYVIEHLHAKKLGACEQSARHIPVFLTRGNAPRRMIMDLCIVFSYVKSAPELLKNQCVQ